MPSYTTYGQLLRSWQRQVDAEIEDTEDAREAAMADIDDALNAVLPTPFHAWLRILDVFGGNSLRLSPEDVGFLNVGDTIGFYNNVTKKLGVYTTMIESISGNDVVVNSVGDMAADGEIAVAWTYEAGGRTLTVIGPPKEIQMCSRALARYYAMGDIIGLDDPSDTVADAYDHARKWLEERGRGIGSIKGASYRDQVYSTTIDEQPAIDIDEGPNWDWDDDAKERVRTERI